MGFPTLPARPGCCVTFAVDAVTPAAKRLAESSALDAIDTLVGRPEACGRPKARYVHSVYLNALGEAVHYAFSDHRPLILTPDAVWLTIVQGIGHHVALDPERWRSRLVPHAGMAKILVAREDLIPGDSENPWDEIVEMFREQIVAASLVSDRLTAQFSTTGPYERLAQSAALMDVMNPFFDYRVVFVCGIPEVSLAGKVEDWELLASKVEELPDLGLDWWYSAIKPLSAEFARAASGQPDLDHWRGIYRWTKPGEPCSLGKSSGWFFKLFPYLVDNDGKACVKNPLLEIGSTQEVVYSELPGGMSRVPLTWSDPRGDRPLTLWAGISGITQENLALRPAVNWAVVPVKES